MLYNYTVVILRNEGVFSLWMACSSIAGIQAHIEQFAVNINYEMQKVGCFQVNRISEWPVMAPNRLTKC